jgi:hypothetical protein
MPDQPSSESSRMLFCHIISLIDLLSRKISSFILNVKDDRVLETPGVYVVCCECGQIYRGQTGCSANNIVKKHHQHIWLDHLDKSAMVEDSTSLRHYINLFQTISIPYIKPASSSGR